MSRRKPVTLRHPMTPELASESRRHTQLGLLESLERLLRAERARGYDDQAVSAGLEHFLENLLQGEDELARAIGLYPLSSFSYAAMSQEERGRWVLSLLRRVEQLKASLSTAPTGKQTTKKPEVEAAGRRETSLVSPVTALAGIGPRLARKLDRLGVRTVRDLIYFFPRRHLDYTLKRNIAELEPNLEQTVVGEVKKVFLRKGSGRGRAIVEAVISDPTGTVKAIWYNQPYLVQELRGQDEVMLSGKVTWWRGQKTLRSPEYELSSSDPVHAGRLVPVYPLTEGLSPRTVRRIVKQALDAVLPRLRDFLPAELKGELQLLDLPEAIRQAHYPEDMASWDRARRRLAFDELFLLQLGLLKQRQEWEGAVGIKMEVCPELLKGLLSRLPFSLTSAQRRVLEEIVRDLTSPRPMNRLLQGEVGSGKTVVALLAMLLVVANGYQAALMVPTEILAQQHYQNICSLLAHEAPADPLSFFPDLLPRPFAVGLLTGGLRGRQKRELHRLLAQGKIDLLIGTHALIQEGVVFDRLGLVIVDEQHRFGVRQRLTLREKGFSPHVLVMSATPIPRSLALTIYGDLDLSVLDELPPGRKEVKTRWLGPRQRKYAYDFIRQQVSEGHQAFIVCPLIEESEVIESAAAVREYKRLSAEVFPDLRLGLLHGRMLPAEKEDVMQKFRSGELDILVSTPVVEVGIDVPNATVILIEGAERFGLAQLHQLRGRVWRSSYQAYCLLLAEKLSPEARARLSIIERTHDGFALAEEDLKLRGPGEFFGTRQTGFAELRMARLSDIQLLEVARLKAQEILSADPLLERYPLLAREAQQLWRASMEPS